MALLSLCTAQECPESYIILASPVIFTISTRWLWKVEKIWKRGPMMSLHIQVHISLFGRPKVAQWCWNQYSRQDDWVLTLGVGGGHSLASLPCALDDLFSALPVLSLSLTVTGLHFSFLQSWRKHQMRLCYLGRPACKSSRPTPPSKYI